MNGIDAYTAEQERQIEKIVVNSPYGNEMEEFNNYMIGRTMAASRARYVYLVDKYLKSGGKHAFGSYLSYLAKNESNLQLYYALQKYSKFVSVRDELPDYMKRTEPPKRKESMETKERREKSILTDEQVASIIENISNKEKWMDIRDEAIIKLFLCTGLRCSAMIKLDVSSIDLANLSVKTTEKGGKNREIEIPESIVPLLMEWIVIRNTRANDDEPALFISNRNTRISKTAMETVTRKCADVHPHQFRRTYGSKIYRETGDIYFAQKALGHSHPSTTELYVCGMDKELSHKAADIMSKFIS